MSTLGHTVSPKVKTSYLVCATPRSGSSLLCDVLAGSGLAGNPEEYFWKLFEPEWAKRWDVSTYRDYLRAALSGTSTPNGVFGAKMMWEHVDYFQDELAQLPEYDGLPLAQLLPTVFPNLHYIWIHRQDTVRQAVSLSRALQTGIWNSRGDGQQTSHEPSFDFEAIDRLAAEIACHDTCWQRFFDQHDLRPFEVTYECLELDPEAVAIDILRYLGVPYTEPVTFAPRKLHKQADGLSEEWVRRYHAMRADRDRGRTGTLSALGVRS